MEPVKLGRNGQVAIPRAVMRRLNLRGDEMLLLDVTDDGVIRLRPATVLPVEIYSDARVREFEETSEVDAQLRERVRQRTRRAP